MDRIKALIDRLNEMHEQGADVAHLKMTAQLLLAEIQQQEIKSKTRQNSGKVSVVMPASHAAYMPAEEPVPVAEHHTVPEVHTEEFVPVTKKEKVKAADRSKELHEVLGTSSESLNDKLKEKKTELAEVLTDTPIKDLKKAISLNERFIFIAELFQNNESMFDRSVKTLNSFNILSEAMFWLDRELKTKLEWDDKNETVQHFVSLVKRRYA